MGMQWFFFVIRKPDLYYLLFEKAVVRTSAKKCPYISHLAQICLHLINLVLEVQRRL